MSARPPTEALAFFVKGVWGGGPSGNGKSPMSMSTSVSSTRTELVLLQKVEMRGQEPQMTLLCVEEGTHTTKVAVQGQEPQMIWHCVEKGIHTTNSQG
jgi:hypothetical protein